MAKEKKIARKQKFSKKSSQYVHSDSKKIKEPEIQRATEQDQSFFEEEIFFIFSLNFSLGFRVPLTPPNFVLEIEFSYDEKNIT